MAETEPGEMPEAGSEPIDFFPPGGKGANVPKPGWLVMLPVSEGMIL